MWVIRQYGTRNDELRQYLELPDATKDDLEETLGTAPAEYGSTPLDMAAMGALAERFGFRVPADSDVEYFLDFDAPPRERTWKKEPATSATA